MRRRRLGTALIVVGLVALVGGVLYVLEAANGPGTGPKSFAERRPFVQVRHDFYAAFPVGGSIALAGFGLMLLGGRVRNGPGDPS